MSGRRTKGKEQRWRKTGWKIKNWNSLRKLRVRNKKSNFILVVSHFKLVKRSEEGY